jgi:centrosomal protein CEP104
VCSFISFVAIHSSGEDDEYPAAELNHHTPQTKGWQSAKFCEYPQELGFEIESGESHLSQVQILSHQCKIATKVEVFIGQGNDYHTATYKRLGYLSLDSNERSSYQARELKTVYVDHQGRFIRLLVHHCYTNKYNHFNQVGIVAVNFLGSEGTGGGRGSEAKSYAGGFSGSKGGGGGSLQDLSLDLNLDKHTADKLRMLSEAKSRAVSTEDYLTAKQIKSVEGELKEVGTRLAQLDVAKRQAVNNEDYDRAKSLKDEIDILREEMEDKIRGIHISGITDVSAAAAATPTFRSAGGGGGGGGSVGGGDSTHTPVSARNTARSFRAEPKEILNVDDMVVGGGNGSGGGQYDDDQFDDDQYGEPQMQMSARNNSKFAPQTEEEYDDDESDDRPIKPKSNTNYNDRDPEVDGDILEETESRFPPGEHPLEGCPNVADLPEAEELSTKSRAENSDVGIITHLIGEYRTCCLFSKTWALREAALYKTRLLLTKDFVDSPGIAVCIATISAIIKVGIADKIVQVFAVSLQLLDDALALLQTGENVSKSVVVPAMEPIIVQLIEKLNDGAARIRDSSRSSIRSMANAPSIGCSVVSTHMLRALPPKQKTAWRPILGRLQLLKDLVDAHGVGSSSGLTPENALNFVKSLSAYSHSNGEVRDAAKYLTVALHKHVGVEPLTPYLDLLRSKQREEYGAAFDGEDDGSAKLSARGGDHHSSHSKAKGGGVNTTAVKSGKKDDPSTASKDGNNDNDFTTCMFCGKGDKAWDEDGLDLHYWMECPLLSPCPSCAQIVEIAGLPEHLLDECEQKNAYQPCDTTGLAIRKDEFEAWSQGPSCVAPPENCMYCPLCLASVEDTDTAWRDHLLYGCPKNGRSYAT